MPQLPFDGFVTPRELLMAEFCSDRCMLANESVCERLWWLGPVIPHGFQFLPCPVHTNLNRELRPKIILERLPRVNVVILLIIVNEYGQFRAHSPCCNLNSSLI